MHLNLFNPILLTGQESLALFTPSPLVCFATSDDTTKGTGGDRAPEHTETEARDRVRVLRQEGFNTIDHEVAYRDLLRNVRRTNKDILREELASLRQIRAARIYEDIVARLYEIDLALIQDEMTALRDSFARNDYSFILAYTYLVALHPPDHPEWVLARLVFCNSLSSPSVLGPWRVFSRVFEIYKQATIKLPEDDPQVVEALVALRPLLDSMEPARDLYLALINRLSPFVAMLESGQLNPSSPVREAVLQSIRSRHP